MSTNYYAHWRPQGASGVIVELHIGKSYGAGGGKIGWILRGDNFPSWAEWKSFLLHQATRERVRIVDEYDTRHEVAEWVARVEASSDRGSRSKQYELVHDRNLDREYDYWLDPDGFSMTGTEFS